MTAKKISLKVFRKSVLLDKKLNVLCGAGISMIAPTALPSGNQLRDQCVFLLLSDHLSRKLIKGLLRSPAYQTLLPEGVLQDIGSFASAGLDRLISSLLVDVTPNAVHQHLARNYHNLFTTNFDLCLEACGAPSVTHLHGTISEPESLQNRLFRLGQTAHAEFAKFKSRIRGNRLLILGYSLRDQDILEAIQAAPPREILYLSYDGSLPTFLEHTSIAVSYAQGGADELFGVLPTKGRSSRRFSHRPIRQLPMKRRVPALLHLLYRAGFYLKADGVMRTYLPYLRGRGKYKAICLLVDALRIGGKYDEALWWCDYIMRSRFANKPENAEILSSAFVVHGLVDLDRGLGNFKEIESRFEEGLRLTKRFEVLQKDGSQKAAIQIWKARIYNNLGLVASAQKRYTKAITYYNKSLRIKEKYHEETGIAQTQANLAKVYVSTSNFSQAIACLRLVVRLMEKSPSKYICADTITETLSQIDEQFSLPVSLRNPTLPIRKRSRFWHKLKRHLDSKKSKAVILIPELERLNDILLNVAKP